MAKAKNPPPATSEPDDLDESIILLAEMLLGEHFFDPDSEDAYKQALSKNRPAGLAGILLNEETIELPDETEAEVRIEALRAWTHFRVVLSHPEFSATVEGVWSFENEALDKAKVHNRTGDPDTIEALVESLMEEIEGSDLDDGDLASFLEGLEDEDDIPAIGDDPTAPPEPTALERGRVKAIAKRVARKSQPDLTAEDRSWLEQAPQALPLVTELMVEAASAPKRDEALVLAYLLMLGQQLETVRYRQDRGWDWANAMLEAFQQRLVALGDGKTVPRPDWVAMCGAMTDARVPVPDTVAVALAEAGFDMSEAMGPPEEMMQGMRDLLGGIAEMVSTPFEVVQALQSSGAVLPAAVRGFLVTELALSPHQVLRDAAPVMLLDEDSSVREAASGALDQTARPGTMSPGALRRAIAVRNWVPAANRPALDAAIRKARVAGVETGAWPEPVGGLEFHASMIDGSGAQSVIAISRAGKKGLFAGLLVRHGTGVVDVWVDRAVSRGKIGKMLREAQMATPHTQVDKAFVDVLAQNAIGLSVSHDAVPPASLLELAEALGASEWKDRRLDVAAEAERLFEGLDPMDRSANGIEAGYARGLEWMAGDEVFATWFEDGPQVQKALAKLPRTDRVGMVEVVMTEILPPRRAEWAERFLMMALWHQAAAEPKQRARARDVILVARALSGNGPLGAIPIMAVIAMQTVRGVLLGGW